MSEANVAPNEDAHEEPSNEDQAMPVEPADPPLENADARPELFDLPDELNRANERALRAQAELENFRKRTRREMDEDRRYASLPLIADLLPAIDNLDRAVEAAEQSEGGSGLLEGVKMVRSQLFGVLERFHCRRIEAIGTIFDPNLQEAIGKESSEEHAAGVVTRVVGIGYQLHDRVVRPSQVLVSSGPAPIQEPLSDQRES